MNACHTPGSALLLAITTVGCGKAGLKVTQADGVLSHHSARPDAPACR